MRVVVLGCTGMAGHVIFNLLKEYKYDVFGMSRRIKNTKNTQQIDAHDFRKLEDCLDIVCPDVIVNCIGILNEDAEKKPDSAILLNAYLPHWLARKYSNSNTNVIHLSTDCVFAGSKGSYKEDDFRDGDTMYDRSKILGEINNHKDLTFRMSIVGPDMTEKGRGLFNWFMLQHGQINGYTQVFWNGITTIELAKAIDQAIKEQLTGLYHLVPNSFINKHDLLCLFKKVFNRKDIIINEEDSIKKDKTLINTRKDFSYTLRTYPEMIEEMKVWIKEHDVLYQHNSFYKN